MRVLRQLVKENESGQLIAVLDQLVYRNNNFSRRSRYIGFHSMALMDTLTATYLVLLEDSEVISFKRSKSDKQKAQVHIDILF